MKPRELRNLGLEDAEHRRLAGSLVAGARAAGLSADAARRIVRAVVEAPGDHLDDPHFAALAAALVAAPARRESTPLRATPAPVREWGDDLDPESRRQLADAARLPIAVRGALMPDAHVGYGLPIGGVLATRDAVIPYAVGVDIACRMRLSVLDLPPTAIDGQGDRLAAALERETRFGMGAAFAAGDRAEHAVLDADWAASPVTSTLKDKAWSQLGTSGSGNHFVEFGLLEVRSDHPTDPALPLDPGRYLALLSHSGSRGAGARVASHYSRLAMDAHPELAGRLRHLAWLDLESSAGAEYWRAMELMGAYAAANHEIIHRRLARALGARAIASVENHHNFAWLEEHDGERVIVHRKGATPAARGVLGIVPGSMASPAFLVRGLGNEASLRSASHGAGRRLSRTAARTRLTWSQARAVLAERRVRLLSAGLDEVPMAYKDIHAVMAAQRDLVETLAEFHPRIVRMAPEGEKAED